jgi:H+/Cl- antiporter ClcA
VNRLPKGFLTEYRLELSSLLTLLFCFVTIVGVVGVFLADRLPSSMSFFKDLTDPIGSWAYWFVVVGPICLVAAVWWLYDYLKKSKKLADLMKTPSKAKFVRNLDDIEYLAWSLPQRFEDQVLKKKRDFGV